MSRKDEALLGPGTVSWRVNREATLMAGGGRALLLQVAHPLVAAGVANHSNYRAEPWQRLYRTMDTMIKIAFGDRETSAAAAQRLTRRHGPVKGVADDGRRYDASDPDLLLWVWATLVESSVTVHGLVFEPLSDAECDAFLSEQQLVAHACGVPEGSCPPSWADFSAYFQRVVDTELTVTDAARDVAASITDPTMLPRPLGPYAAKVGEALTAGLLPPKLRAEYGFEWGPEMDRRFRRAVRNVRLAARLTPRPLRQIGATVLSRPRKDKAPPARAGAPSSA